MRWMIYKSASLAPACGRRIWPLLLLEIFMLPSLMQAQRFTGPQAGARPEVSALRQPRSLP